MKALSMDLRERIVAAYLNKEGSHVVLAKRFRVSPCAVGKLVRQLRERGTLEPQVHLRGRKPAVRSEKEEDLRQHLQKITCDELANAFSIVDIQAHKKVNCSRIHKHSCSGTSYFGLRVLNSAAEGVDSCRCATRLRVGRATLYFFIIKR